MAQIESTVEKRFDAESLRWTQNNKYNDIISWERYQRLVHTMNFLKPLKHKKIDLLEIGCGAGHNMLRFCANKKWKVTGADIAQNMINTCKKHLKNAGYSNFTLIKKDFQKEKINKKYDVIVLLGVVGYFKNNAQVFEHISGMLKDDGLLIFTFGNKQSIFRKIRGGLSHLLDKSKLITNTYNKLKRNSGTYQSKANNFNCYTSRHIHKITHQQNLLVLQQRNIGFASGIMGSLSVKMSLLLEHLYKKKDPFRLAITIIQVYTKNAEQKTN